MTRRSGVVLLAAALALARAARAQEEEPPPPPSWAGVEGRAVAAVVWSGLRGPTAQELIETRAGATFSAATAAADLARLHRSGRFRPPLRLEVREAEAGRLVVEVELRERPRLARLEVDGALDDEDREATLGALREGEPLDPFALHRAARDLRARLRAAGHADAVVEARTAPDGDEVAVTVVVRPGPRVHVEAIEWRGAEALDPAKEAGKLGLEVRPRSWLGLGDAGTFDPDGHDRDLERVRAWYRGQGHLDASVHPLEQRRSPDGTALTLVVAVDEGPRWLVRRAAVEGAALLDPGALLRELPLVAGRPLLQADVDEACRRVRRLYGQRSRVRCRVDVERTLDPARPLADLTLRVTEGPEVRLEEVRLAGNRRTRDEVYRRELGLAMGLAAGDPIDADALEEGLARLERLGWLAEPPAVELLPGAGPGREHLLVTVREGQMAWVRVGGAVSTSLGVFGDLRLELRNFDLLRLPAWVADPLDHPGPFGAGQTLELLLQPGTARSQYSARFVEPWLLGLPIELELEAFARDRTREDWLEQRRGGQVGLGWRPRPDLLARVAYRLERVHVGDLERDAAPEALEVAGSSRVGYARLSLGLDRQRIDVDQVAYAGWTASAHVDLADRLLGSDHDFVRAGAAAGWHTTLFEWPRGLRWTFGLRGEAGWIEPRGRSDDVPIFERLFAGGQGSVRGFVFRSLSPRSLDRPRGGRWLAAATAELGFPLFDRWLRGVAFVDAGGAVDRLRDLERDDHARVAAGFGLRLRVPLIPAPIALDFAWPLRKRRDDDAQVFSFYVGLSF